MKIVFFILLSFLAIIGVSYIIFELYYRLTKLNNDNVSVLLYQSSGDKIDIEFSVRSMIAKAKRINAKNILCLTDNLDDYDIKVLSLLKKDYPYLKILKTEDFIKKSGL